MESLVDISRECLHTGGSKMAHSKKVLARLSEIIIAVPKGSLGPSVHELLRSLCIYYKPDSRSVEFVTHLGDLKVVVKKMAAQSIPRFLFADDKENGKTLKVGITGLDCIKEDEEERKSISKDSRKLTIIRHLPVNKKTTGKIGVVAACWKRDSNDKIKEKLKKKTAKIITEYLYLTKKAFPGLPRKNYQRVISGAEDEFVSHGGYDLVVCVRETGTSLETNECEVFSTLMKSTTVLVAKKRNRYLTLLGKYLFHSIRSPGTYDHRLGAHKSIQMHVPKEIHEEVIAAMPSMLSPTSVYIKSAGAYDINIIIEEKLVLPLWLRIGGCVSGWAEKYVDRVIP